MDNSQHHVAVLGASPKPARYANQCIRLLQQHGYRITPIHPRFDDIEGLPVAHGIDAIIATNTTLSRDGLSDRQASEAGGLSGRPLFERSTRVLARLYRMTGGHIPLIGVGGVGSVDDSWQKLRAGASAIQLYSALIYQGFSLAEDIARGLDQRAAEEGLTSLSELTGTGVEDWL